MYVKLEDSNVNQEKRNVKLEESKVKLKDSNVNQEKRNVKLVESEVKLDDSNVNQENRNFKLVESEVKLDDSNVNQENRNFKLGESKVKLEDSKVKHEDNKVKLEDSKVKLEDSKVKQDGGNIKSNEGGTKPMTELVRRSVIILERCSFPVAASLSYGIGRKTRSSIVGSRVLKMFKTQDVAEGNSDGNNGSDDQSGNINELSLATAGMHEQEAQSCFICGNEKAMTLSLPCCLSRVCFSCERNLVILAKKLTSYKGGLFSCPGMNCTAKFNKNIWLNYMVAATSNPTGL